MTNPNEQSTINLIADDISEPLKIKSKYGHILNMGIKKRFEKTKKVSEDKPLKINQMF